MKLASQRIPGVPCISMPDPGSHRTGGGASRYRASATDVWKRPLKTTRFAQGFLQTESRRPSFARHNGERVSTLSRHLGEAGQLLRCAVILALTAIRALQRLRRYATALERGWPADAPVVWPRNRADPLSRRERKKPSSLAAKRKTCMTTLI